MVPLDFYIDYETGINKSVKIINVTKNFNVAYKVDVVVLKVVLSCSSLPITNSYSRFGIPGSAMDFESSFDISDTS